MAEDTAAAAILETLLDQRAHRIERGFYWENQIAFVYNSERTEGNPLTVDQTRSIFETQTVSGTAIPSRYIQETQNHFRLFDTMLDTIDEPLSIDLIKRFHEVLKTGTPDDLDNPDFVVGDWKKLPNTVGGILTTPPSDVGNELERLLAAYSRKQDKTLEDILGFHVFFERIHPFQDGNGRVGRIIMFRECLRNGIVPFIVLDEEKARYYEALSRFENDRAFFTDFAEGLTDRYLDAYASLLPEHLLLGERVSRSVLPSTIANEAETFFREKQADGS